MSRKQIRVYVELDEWEGFKAEIGIKTDRDLMDHVMRLYRSMSQLKTINPDPVVAVGVALANHQILGSAQWQRHLNISTVDRAYPDIAAPKAQPETPVEPTEKGPIDDDDNSSEY